MELVRAIITDLSNVGSGQSYRLYTSTGRPDEVVSGKFYQHYGYMSRPAPGLSHVTIQQGDSQISIAENSGASQTLGNNLNYGDVLVFTDGIFFPGGANTFAQHSSYVYMKAPTNGTSASDDVRLDIISDGKVSIEAGTNKAQIIIDKTGQITVQNQHGTITIDQSTGQVSINNGNLTVDV